jgi:hypothetical protein
MVCFGSKLLSQTRLDLAGYGTVTQPAALEVNSAQRICQTYLLKVSQASTCLRTRRQNICSKITQDLRSSLSSDVTQRILVVSCRLFGNLTINLRCLTYQKCAGLIYTVPEASNHTKDAVVLCLFYS